MTRLASEDDFLAAIDRHFTNAHPHLCVGRGDDCAVIACPPRMAVSTDLFNEHSHFRTSYFTPGDIGHKALAVNISDLAASGARPLGFSLALTAPADLSREFCDEMLGAMAALAREYDMALSGGDLTRGDALSLCITVWGGAAPRPVRAAALKEGGEGNVAGDASEVAPVGTRPQPAAGGASPFLRRGGCQPGDQLFLVGRVGLARVGLLALESMGAEAARLYPEACRAHLRPRPQVAAGQALAAICGTGDARIALMDVSDGLARDLPRLIGADRGSGLGAELVMDAEALPGEVRAYALANDLDPVDTAFTGGEDYALLGCCRPAMFEAVRAAVPGLIPLGRVTADGMVLVNGDLPASAGFDHFSG
ncbi:thiamine-phosphate kinase [Nitratidesulfovibrio sp. SRB-5]|uniref:thiamine-phosphate kinase n=1 Tax=Nitratidesulfovibrio sp. SRB-5 TaxID=2872636 RepID=UPI0010267B57|nr:thiamine-phosphate kinase [Nitratidesulfovibrio sp. SRB-5]MBZ2173432.1 thiamine-phosphate kinase [Nitratidesulfovibrio sp. SRB-5]RXF74022.1 thiamine-monophosphate kinase [Desulfovibrio sp. DS-1]